MSFYTQYELQEPIPGGTVRSFKARQIATQREVRVHLLVGQNDEVMRQLRILSPEKRPLIVDQGNNDGTLYVVTLPLPGDSGFEEWLSAPVGAPPPVSASPQNLGRSGQWNASGLHQSPVAPPPPAAGGGEFTRMFQGPSAV